MKTYHTSLLPNQLNFEIMEDVSDKYIINNKKTFSVMVQQALTLMWKMRVSTPPLILEFPPERGNFIPEKYDAYDNGNMNPVFSIFMFQLNNTIHIPHST